MSKDINELVRLSTTTSDDISKESLDRVYNEILYPLLEKRAKNFKVREMDINSHQKSQEVKQILPDFNLQSLIETEMKPYLIEKGFKIVLWSPKYSVTIKW